MGETGGQADSATIQKAQADHATDLFNIGSPGFKLALNSFIKDLGQPGQIPDSVKKAFGAMKDQTTKQFDQEEVAAPSTIAQQMKQSGGRFAKGAESYTADKVLASLEQGRMSAMNDLQVNEVNQGLAQQQFDLQNIFGLVSGSMNQSNAFANNAMQAAGFNTKNPWGSAATGAASGASMGAAAGGWGALAGGIIGGAAGYFGSG